MSVPFLFLANLDKRAKPNDQDLNKRTMVSSFCSFAYLLLSGNVINVPFFFFFRADHRIVVIMHYGCQNSAEMITVTSIRIRHSCRIFWHSMNLIREEVYS